MTTELTGIEPAAAAPPPADNSAGNAHASNGSGGESGNPNVPSPDKDNLDWIKAKGWVNDDGSFKSIEIAKGYQNLEKHLGSIVRVPDETAKPEEWDKFHSARGWPGKPEGYNEFLKVPDNLPPNMPYDEGLATEFKNVANDLRLPAQTAAKFHDWYVSKTAERFAEDVKAFEVQTVESAKSAHSEYVKNWGDPGTPAYSQNVEAARRALTGDPKLAGAEQALKEAGLLTKDGKFTNFWIGHLLANHGKQFMNDSFVAPNGAGRSAENPFARTQADGTPNPAFNLTVAGQLIKQNPVEAKQLILAAGLKPEEYGL